MAWRPQKKFPVSQGLGIYIELLIIKFYLDIKFNVITNFFKWLLAIVLSLKLEKHTMCEVLSA